MSALDKLLARCDETAFRMALTSFADTDADDAIGIGMQVEAARAEVAAMRQRVEDLEMIARHTMKAQMMFHWDSEEARWYFAPTGPTAAGEWSYLYMPDDGTGLPLLTDEARKALRGRE